MDRELQCAVSDLHATHLKNQMLPSHFEVSQNKSLIHTDYLKCKTCSKIPLHPVECNSTGELYCQVCMTNPFVEPNLKLKSQMKLMITSHQCLEGTPR